MVCTAGIPAASTFTNDAAANTILAAASSVRAAPTLGTAIANQLTCISLARLLAARLPRAGPSPYNTSNKQNQSSRQTIFRKHSRSPYSICISIKIQKSNTNLAAGPFSGFHAAHAGLSQGYVQKSQITRRNKRFRKSEGSSKDLANQSGKRQNSFAQSANRQSEDCQSAY